MDKIKPLYTATATAPEAATDIPRAATAWSRPHLSLPKEMGGPGRPGTATPEHLFAAGYAACFGGAIDFVGKQQKRTRARPGSLCAVTIGARELGGFGLSVTMRSMIAALSRPDLAALAREAHEKICPYSHATRGNVDVQFEVVGA